MKVTISPCEVKKMEKRPFDAPRATLVLFGAQPFLLASDEKEDDGRKDWGDGGIELPPVPLH